MPIVLIAAAAIVSPAFAATGSVHGNDGNFCTAKGYIAFDDLELSNATGAVSAHSLRVVRFEDGRGIYFSEQIRLPEDLAVQGLSCSTNRVELVGHTLVEHTPRDPLLTRCVIEIGVPESNSDIANCFDEPAEKLAKLRNSASLAIFRSEAPIPLESIDGKYSYQLIRHLSLRRVRNGVESRSKCEVVRLDKTGSILNRLVIYENRVMHDAD